MRQHANGLFTLEKNFYSDIAVAISGCDLVSFDLFDTLFRRPFLHPTHLFDCIGSELNDNEFGRNRRIAEAMARRKYADSIDISLHQIYEFLDKDPALELDREGACLTKRTEVCSMLALAREKRKRIVVISDMYWPAGDIAKLLAKHELVVDDLVVSSTDGVAKFDGSAFRLVAKRHSVPFSRILHFGDNRHSDYAVPAGLGMKAVLVGDWAPAEPTCQLTDRLLARLATNGSHRSSTVGAAIRDLRFKYGHDEFWSDLGRYHVGPLVHSFASWLGEIAEKYRLQRLIFVARDGWLPFKAFRLLNTQLDSSYAYLSRAVLVQAALGTSSETAMRQLVSGVPAHVSDYIRRIGLSAQRLLPIALEAFGGDPVIRTEADRKRLASFFFSQADSFAAVGKKSVERLRAYLSQLGAFDNPDRVAFVDVGWSGTGASILSELFPEARESHYLFWGTIETFQPRDAKHVAQFFQFGEPWDYRALAFECIEIVEFLLSSPEGSVIGLNESSQGFIPIFTSDEEGWPERVQIANAIEEGVMQCLEYFGAHKNRYPPLAVDRHAVFSILENILRTDDPNCVRLLGSIRHQLGMGDSKIERLLPDLSDRYWSTIWRWFRGRGIKSGNLRIYWPYQQEKYFLASVRGFRRALAERAYKAKRGGGLRIFRRKKKR